MGFHSKPTTFIGHVKIKVQDLNRSINFYRDILGFDVLEKTSSSVKLTTDGKSSFLSLEQPENVTPKENRATGLYHFAILLPDKTHLANITIHLARNGIQFGASDHLVSEALYLQDPDGNEIEIYRDRKPSEWTWNGDEVAMTTKPLNFDRLLTHATEDQPWDRMPAETLMGHIHLHVSELEKTEEFYVKGLGMDIVNRFGTEALFLSYGKYHHHVAVNTWKGVGAKAPAQTSVGLEYYSLVFDNEDVRLETINNLKAIGATVEEENNRYVTYDPSGNAIELTV